MRGFEVLQDSDLENKCQHHNNSTILHHLTGILIVLGRQVRSGGVLDLVEQL